MINKEEFKTVLEENPDCFTTLLSCIIMDIPNLFESVVNEVRETLAEKYDVNNFWSENYKYRGLCDEASNLFKEIMEEIINSDQFRNIPDWSQSTWDIKIIHGEQTHTYLTESQYWGYQHTMVYVTINIIDEYDYTFREKIHYYVDPTSSQFYNIYEDVPDYYIHFDKPFWFYPDIDNWYISKTCLWIDDHLRIKLHDEDGTVHSVGIIEYLIYGVWGKICDKFRIFIHGK